MLDTYFILTTSSITEAQKDGCVGDFETQRQNNDTTKTVLEVCNFNANDTEGAFYGKTPYTRDEAVIALDTAEWQ